MILIIKLINLKLYIFLLFTSWHPFLVLFNNLSFEPQTFVIFPIFVSCPVSWGCRIYRLLFCWGVRSPTNECPGYDTKQSDGEVPELLELWGMGRAPALPSLPGPLYPGVVAPDKLLIYRLNRTKPWFLEFTVLTFKLCTCDKLNCPKYNCFDI